MLKSLKLFIAIFPHDQEKAFKSGWSLRLRSPGDDGPAGITACLLCNTGDLESSIFNLG